MRGVRGNRCHHAMESAAHHPIWPGCYSPATHRWPLSPHLRLRSLGVAIAPLSSHPAAPRRRCRSTALAPPLSSRQTTIPVFRSSASRDDGKLLTVLFLFHSVRLLDEPNLGTDDEIFLFPFRSPRTKTIDETHSWFVTLFSLPR